jgi:hypothetical protein
MSNSPYVFPLDENGHVPEEAQFRVLYPALVYGDLAPEDLQGKVLAKRDDLTNFYPELRRYPDRVQLLCTLRRVEYVPPVKINRPVKVQEKKATEGEDES